MSTATASPSFTGTIKVGREDVKEAYVTMPIMAFVLNIGQHIGRDENHNARQWFQGMRIKTRQNLTRRFGAEKFTRIHPDTECDQGIPFEVEAFVDSNAMMREINRDSDEMGQFAIQQELARQSAQSRDPAQPLRTQDDLPKGEHFDGSKAATYNQASIEELMKICKDEEISLPSGKLTKAQIVQRLIDNDNAASRGMG